MKKFVSLVASMSIIGGLSLLSADALSDFNKNSTKDAVEYIQKNKLEIVDFEYVKKMVGDGARTNALATIIDSRPLPKYEQGHIPTSLSLPDTKFDAMYESVLGKTPKDRELITYCGGYACTKSHELAVMLRAKGHTNIKVYAAGMPEWSQKSYDEISSVTAKGFFESKKGLFVDSRPYGKFATGTIIGSLNIPDTKIDEYLGWFPNDKNVVVIPYCGGYACAKSHEIGNKLIGLGYKNVKVYAGGYPEWQELVLPTTSGAAVVVDSKPKEVKKQVGFLKPGADTGSVDGNWFFKNLNSLPSNVALIDVRDAKSYARGQIKGAINIYAEKMKPADFAKLLPTDKEIVFYCATGTRAMEAREFAKEAKFKNIDSVMYFDANIECNNNDCKIKVNEPVGF